jgi:undecaprenyl-diphosphatase
MRRNPSILLGAIVAAGVGAFALLAWAYSGDGPISEVDREVAAWVAAHVPTWAEWLARPFSWLGGWVCVTLLALGAVALLLRRRRWADALLVVVSLAGIQLLTLGFKQAFERSRPDDGSAIPLPPSYSFPSGHAGTAAAFFGALTLLAAAAAAAAVPAGRRRLLVLAVGAAIALAIGASRVVLNVHYVSDVLAGFALGLAWLALCLLALSSLPGVDRTSRIRHEPVTDT